jgi:hypothetical protein
LGQIRARSLSLLEFGEQALLDVRRVLSLVKDEIDGEFRGGRVCEKIAPQGVFPQLFSLLERCPYGAITEAKAGINVTNAVQNRGTTHALALMPDEHTEHGTPKKQPPDSASDHGATYRSERKISAPFLSAFLRKTR